MAQPVEAGPTGRQRWFGGFRRAIAAPLQEKAKRRFLRAHELEDFAPVDPLIAEVAGPRVERLLPHAARIAQLHGHVAEALAKNTRGGNQVRSFVSKYLHFHAPVVPIYDSVVSTQIRARDWYSWRRTWSERHLAPEGVDQIYWQHCVRIGYIADDWRAEGLKPTARNIDTYVYQWAIDHRE